MKYNLFLDDIRQPEICASFDYLKANGTNTLLYYAEWFIVRNYQQFVDTITNNGLPELISFDHDLGLPAQLEYRKQGASKTLSRKLAHASEKNGFDCAKWLVDFCIDNNLRLPQYLIHSHNPIGRVNIEMFLRNYLNSV